MENGLSSLNRREAGQLFLQLAALLAVPGEALAALAKGSFDVVVQRNVMVAMRDGVHLATDIYLPVRGGAPVTGKVPVLLQRTPYVKEAHSPRHGSIEISNFLASHGYAVVIQNVRGRGPSEGIFVKYLADGSDGVDCCQWLLKQPWCNGKIGAMGLSYDAHTEGALACADAPGLTAMFIDCGAFANAYQDGVRQGGAFEMKQVTWAYNLMQEAPGVADNPELLARIKQVDIKDWFTRLPWSRGHSPLSLVPDYENYVFDQWENGRFSDFWKKIGIYAEGFYDQWPNVPMVMISSWFDAYPRSTVTNYVELRKRNKGPIKLILGPWTHGDNVKTYSGDVDFGAQSTLAGNLAEDYPSLELRWFERWLKGVPNDVENDPNVRIFVMGGGSGRKNAQGRMDHGGKWRAEKDWPVPSTVPTRFYLGGKGELSHQTPLDDAGQKTYKYDPRDPVPSIGGTITSGEPLMAGGAFDQRGGAKIFGAKEPYGPLADRADVLVFQTSVLTSDIEVTGAIEADLWIASNCPDTDFTVKLIDVYPPNLDYPEGYAMNVADGIMRCRYRDSWETPTLMEPGKAYRIRVETFPTSNLFKRGHRIRLDVSSSNYPHFDLNLNTGAPESKGPEVRVATNTIFFDRARPSSVTLPIIPPKV
jgi:uncharacterized protein